MSEPPKHGLGFKCPKCNGSWHKTIKTIPLNNAVVRVRKCRYCGRQFRTKETCPS